MCLSKVRLIWPHCVWKDDYCHHNITAAQRNTHLNVCVCTEHKRVLLCSLTFSVCCCACSQLPVLCVPTGRCASCGENVVGEGTGCTAMDQVFHVDCFICMTCSTKLRGKPFFAVEKKAYCEPCYIVSIVSSRHSTCLAFRFSFPALVFLEGKQQQFCRPAKENGIIVKSNNLISHFRKNVIKIAIFVQLKKYAISKCSAPLWHQCGAEALSLTLVSTWLLLLVGLLYSTLDVTMLLMLIYNYSYIGIENIKMSECGNLALCKLSKTTLSCQRKPWGFVKF